MTNAPFSSGSGGPPPSSFSPGHSMISYPRRSSYASVVAGVSSGHPPGWAGASSNFGTATPSSSYPPQYNRLQRQGYSPDDEMQMNGAGSWRRPGLLPDHSRQFIRTMAQGSGGPTFLQQTNTLFTPSYLKTSRYVAQLAAANNKSKTAASKDTSSTHSSNAPSLSASSSNVNLHRMAPSHRGMTYDIVENAPTKNSEALMPLPSKWSETEKQSGLDILGDGLEVRYMGAASKQEHEAAAVRTNHPMPPQCGIYYFEITIMAKPTEGMIGVGFSNSKASLERLPGWEQESWAYHGDDGKTFFGDNQGQGKSYGPTFGVDDTIGSGVNFTNNTAFFTKNGVFLGFAFRDLKPGKVFPSVGMKKHPGCHVKANFGQNPFVFDIDGMVAEESRLIHNEIQATDFSSLYPSLSEDLILQELVSQFLAHDGYVETARAFSEELKKETNALQAGCTEVKDFVPESDADAVNRQQIRSAILEGDIDKALELTKTHYQSVFDDDPLILFHLRCRKFIEIVRSYSEVDNSVSSKRNKPAKDLPTASDGDVFTHDMELDEHMQDVQDNESMQAESAVHDVFHAQEALEYGQKLKADFMNVNDDRRPYEKALNDIFSLVAYSDPKSSPHGHLLDPSGRVAVAEELNAAILVSLGKSSAAALERVYQQTEALINEISEDGGVGAYINLRSDSLLGLK